MRRMMLCVGCPTAEFHTLEDAAKLYGFQLDDLSREISGGHPGRKKAVAGRAGYQ